MKIKIGDTIWFNEPYSLQVPNTNIGPVGMYDNWQKGRVVSFDTDSICVVDVMGKICFVKNNSSMISDTDPSPYYSYSEDIVIKPSVLP